MKVKFNGQKTNSNNSPLKPKKSILKFKYSLSKININQIPLSRNEINSSNRFSLKRNSKTLPIKQKSVKNLDPDFLVYESPYLLSKIKDFNGLCNELKVLEKQNRMYYHSKKNVLALDVDEEFDFYNMENNLKLNYESKDYNNIGELLKIVDKIKIPPEKRNMNDLLEIMKYLTTTKLGKYFKEGFEQKEIFEKLITFCGVEIKYKFFKKGETVFRIGDLPDNFYIIILGKVDILKPLPKNESITGHQYFNYLMNLKITKDEHLFNLCIKANRTNFKIDEEDERDLKYIYIYIILEQINRHKIVDFDKELKLVNMTCKDFDLDTEKIKDMKYILENIKKIKIYLPDIPTTTISKYLFFKEDSIQKEVILYYYSSFMTLDTKSHFGDSAMDSNTTRNATIAAAEDTHTAYISCTSYFHNVVVEKAALIDKKVQFLNSNFIFGKIGQKKFEKKYFGLFICNNYKKGDILFKEGDMPSNVYFIEQGDVELYTSKNIYELQNVIEYLEQKRHSITKKKAEEVSEETDYFFTYDKINFQEHDLRRDIIKKNKNTILLLKENEDLGLLSFYFGYPYFTTSVVNSATAKIYQIDNKYLSDMILKERIIYNDLINRVEHKLSLFHERFFNINNTKLLLADHQKLLDSNEKRKNTQNFDFSKNNINNRNINNSEENYSFNQKNEFNKTVIKVDYGKLKKMFNKIQKTNIDLNSKYNNFIEKKTNIRISNDLQKSNLPLINTQKSLKISDNISTDKNYSIKLQTLEKNNDDINTSFKGKNYRKKNILHKQNIFKNTSVNRAISIKKNVKNFYLSNILFKNKSCTFVEEKKFCIDPVLKESCEKFEKLNNYKLKRIQINQLDKDVSEEKTNLKTKSPVNKRSFFNKGKMAQKLNDIKPFYITINNFKSCKSTGYSRKNMNMESNYKDEGINNDGNLHIPKDDKKEVLTKKIHRLKFNHPYISPLALMKKHQYEILNGEKPLKENKNKIKKIKSKSQKNKQFNQLGYFFKFINNFNKNFPFKN